MSSEEAGHNATWRYGNEKHKSFNSRSVGEQIHGERGYEGTHYESLPSGRNGSFTDLAYHPWKSIAVINLEVLYGGDEK